MLWSTTHGKDLVCRVPRSRAHGKPSLCRVSRAGTRQTSLILKHQSIQIQNLFFKFLSHQHWKYIVRDPKQFMFHDSMQKILLFHVFQIVSTKSFSIVCLTRFDLTNFSVYLAKVHKHYMLGDSFPKNIISCCYNSILMYIKMIWFNRKINFKINKWIRKMTKFWH